MPTETALPLDLAGKRVVLTGAGGGLGRAIAAMLTGAGARLVACDLPGADLSTLGAAEEQRFDMSDPEAVAAAARAIIDGGPVDVLIANAGGSRFDTLEVTGPEAILEEIARNFTGSAILSRLLVPAMRNRPGGAAAVFTASVNALMHFGNPAYAAAKAGIVAWSRALAGEEGRHGLRSNVVAPGSIRTPAWDERLKQQPDIFDRVSRLYPLGRLVEPGEVARAVLFLASPLSSGISGVVLPVDAGLTAVSTPFLDTLARPG